MRWVDKAEGTGHSSAFPTLQRKQKLLLVELDMLLKIHEIIYINGNIIFICSTGEKKIFIVHYYQYYIQVTYEPHPPIILQN